MSHTLTTLKVVAALSGGRPMTAKELRAATGLSENTVARQLSLMRQMEPPMVEFDSYSPREIATGPAAARWRWAARSS